MNDYVNVGDGVSYHSASAAGVNSTYEAWIRKTEVNFSYPTYSNKSKGNPVRCFKNTEKRALSFESK
jgi:hypothetical protein